MFYSIGIDPDDDVKDPDLMKGLEQFLHEDFTDEEQLNFLDNTIRIMVNRALHLKKWRPPKGLIFSLQQQSKSMHIKYLLTSQSNFVSQNLRPTDHGNEGVTSVTSMVHKT